MAAFKIVSLFVVLALFAAVYAEDSSTDLTASETISKGYQNYNSYGGYGYGGNRYRGQNQGYRNNHYGYNNYGYNNYGNNNYGYNSYGYNNGNGYRYGMPYYY